MTVPDARQQLAELDRETITRRDIQTLFGVSKTQARTLIRQFGGTPIGNMATIPKADLLRQLEEIENGHTFHHETKRRAAVISQLQRARVKRVKVPLTPETLGAKLKGLPEGVTVGRNRIEVSYSTAQEALQLLYALASALVNDYERFESLFDKTPESPAKPGPAASTAQQQSPYRDSTPFRSPPKG